MPRYIKLDGDTAQISVNIPRRQFLGLRTIQYARSLKRGGDEVPLKELVQEALDAYLELHKATIPDDVTLPPAPATRKELATRQRARRAGHQKETD